MKKAPNFCLLDQAENQVCLNDVLAKNKFVLLYFYPKDMTSGCTAEAIGFSNLKEKFEKLGVKILGVSKDSCARHQKFIAKEKLTIDLLSDESCEILEKYGVWVEKSMYGRKYMGISRESFLINSAGEIVQHWPKVKAKAHPAEVLEFIENL